jgi:hypothetical protein
MKKFILFVVLSALTLEAIIGQDNEYVINDITVIIESNWFLGGNTDERELLRVLALDDNDKRDNAYILQKGRVFYSAAELNKAMARWQYQLASEIRVFDSGATIEYSSTGQRDADGREELNFTIRAKETINVLLLPYPKYSSNDGFTIGLRFRHYNFLGSMNTFSGNVNFRSDENNYQYFNADFDYALPLSFFNRDWTLGLAVGGDYYPNNEAFDYDDRIFSSSVSLGTWWYLSERLSLYTALKQSVYVQGAAQDPGKKPGEDPYYLQTSVDLSLPITVKDTAWLGPLVYTVAAGGSTYFRLDGPINDSRLGFFPYLNNSFGASNIKRINNFRQGVSFSVSANSSFDPYKARYWGITGGHRNDIDQYAWNVTLAATVTGFYKINDQLGISARAGYNYGIFRDQDDADLGDVVRGIRDARVQGDMYFFWNVDLINNIFIWRFSKFGEVHGHIFYDGMVVRTFRENWQKPFHTIGIEAVIYPSFSRSLQLRISLGEDIEAMLHNMDIFGTSPRGGSQYELYFGLELHY